MKTKAEYEAKAKAYGERACGHNGEGPNIVIDFQSIDKDQNAFNMYYATHPWTSSGFDKTKASA